MRLNPSDSPAPFVWLASQSPRRQALLHQIGVPFRVLTADTGEDVEALEIHHPGESPTQYVTRVVREKAQAACARLARRESEGAGQHAPILVADTTVAIGGLILGKPQDPDDAARILKALSGRSHRVLTAIALQRGRRLEQRTQVSRVSFARLSPAWIQAYVDSGEPFGKAGAYAVQGAAATMIRRIEGSYSGIMGLPLHETALLLRRAGILPGPFA